MYYYQIGKKYLKNFCRLEKKLYLCEKYKVMKIDKVVKFEVSLGVDDLKEAIKDYLIKKDKTLTQVKISYIETVVKDDDDDDDDDDDYGDSVGEFDGITCSIEEKRK